MAFPLNAQAQGVSGKTE